MSGVNTLTYIKFDGFPASTQGRMLTDGFLDASGEYFAVTEELLDSDTEATADEYAEGLARATQAYEDGLTL